MEDSLVIIPTFNEIENIEAIMFFSSLNKKEIKTLSEENNPFETIDEYLEVYQHAIRPHGKGVEQGAFMFQVNVWPPKFFSGRNTFLKEAL